LRTDSGGPSHPKLHTNVGWTVCVRIRVDRPTRSCTQTWSGGCRAGLARVSRRRRAGRHRGGNSDCLSCLAAAACAACSIVVCRAAAALSLARILLTTALEAPAINSAWCRFRYSCDSRSPAVYAVQFRDHVPGDELPRSQRRLAVGPVVGEAQHDPEAAGDLLEVADRRHEVVRRADHPGDPLRPAVADGLLEHSHLSGRRGWRSVDRGSTRCTRCASVQPVDGLVASPARATRRCGRRASPASSCGRRSGRARRQRPRRSSTASATPGCPPSSSRRSTAPPCRTCRPASCPTARSTTRSPSGGPPGAAGVGGGRRGA
jgi:hypothetical protein